MRPLSCRDGIHVQVPVVHALSFFAWLCLNQCHSVVAFGNEAPPSRRTVVEHLVFGGGVGGLLSLVGNEPALAARGAFELDSEYYLRDLLGGNKKEGSVLPSKPPPTPPPRTLQGPLVPLLLNNDYLPTCIPVQVLCEQVAKQQQQNVAAKSIAEKATDIRARASRSFYSRAPWEREDVIDQYYFDLTAYALWKTAAECLPNYADRDAFVRNVGRRLYQQLCILQPLQLTLSSSSSSSSAKSVVASEAAVVAILNAFRSSNFCKGFRIATDQSLDNNSNNGKNNANTNEPVFDSLDDEALGLGATVACLVSIYEPATLGASLQITGEQSRFAPDLIGPTLAALWEAMGIKSSWEVFFVDPEYRPNPKDYYPNEKLLQFSLTVYR
ncbi:expressed unknown protein [Seminavis robusta]|uniref:Uncharacterized protein n=1 Tax=Seminavis robusta TaxID=568900 RepID=A0A9N8DLE2_9STRA|nr:expressed unknown protein [Seminavis robusta]|eukprot:Sro149_g068430.1 n/a (384) ;mRNA; f:44285-45436